MQHEVRPPVWAIAALVSLVLASCGGGQRDDAAAQGAAAGESPRMAAMAAVRWTLCASEGGSCSFDGQRAVRYGTTDRYVARLLTGPVACSNAVFGDPAVGLAKRCWVSSTTRSDPENPPAPAPAGVVARLDATRLAGPAPLAVLFDASTSTAPAGLLAFHQLSYEFDFGDERGQRWGHSGLPRNTQQGGPLAAHVFDLPGVYTVRVRARSATGASAEASITVTVQDADSAFSGTRTLCVSSSANYASCPASAARQTTLPAQYAGTRVLLRRGESFPAVQPRNTDSGFQVGAFGSGAKPVIAGMNTRFVSGVASWASDFTVMDLNIGSEGASINGTTTRFLLYRNDIRTPGNSDAMLDIGTIAGYYHDHDRGPVPASIYWPREVFIVDNDIQGVVNAAGGPNLVVMGHFDRSALLGNTIDHAREHSLRVWAANKFVIGHNLIGGNHHAPNPPGIRGAVKIHAAGAQPFASTIANGRFPATSQLVMADNVIGSVTYPGSFLSGFGPQNADPGTVEGLEDCIAERNHYVRGPFSSSELQLRGRRLTARGNTLQGGGTPDIVRIGANFDPGMAAWDGPYFITP